MARSMMSLRRFTVESAHGVRDLISSFEQRGALANFLLLYEQLTAPLHFFPGIDMPSASLKRLYEITVVSMVRFRKCLIYSPSLTLREPCKS